MAEYNLSPWNQLELGNCISKLPGTGEFLSFFFKFYFFLFWAGISVDVTVCLPHHCVFGSSNIFLEFCGSMMERNCVSQWITPRASLIPDFDDVDDVMWVFWAEEIWALSWCSWDFWATWVNLLHLWGWYEFWWPDLGLVGRKMAHNGVCILSLEPVNMLCYTAKGN